MKFELIHRKGDVFSELNKEDVFLHACNAVGRWGSGVAVDFKKHFPGAYAHHLKINNRVGMGYILEDDGYKVGCLITSGRYGQFKDSPKNIIVNTYESILRLLESLDHPTTIQSPKINSGLFAVPWKHTEKTIKTACEVSGKEIKWVVWEYVR